MKKIILTFFFFYLTCFFCKAQNEGWAICNSGANLYFKIIGTGNPVLVVSDAGNSSDYLKELIQTISETNRVIYYDSRATGKSRLPVIHDTTLNFNKAVEDIEALRQVLRIPKWSILAHGFGANIAGAYATRYGAVLQQLVLVNPDSQTTVKTSQGAYFDTFEDYDFTTMLKPATLAKRFDQLQKQLRTGITPADTLNYWRAVMAFQAPTYVYDTLNEPMAVRYLYERQKNAAVKQRVRDNTKSQQFEVLKGLRTYRGEVMIVFSKKRNDLPKLVKGWREIVPRSQVVLIDKAHHFPWLDNPAVFYTQIKPFLSKPIAIPTQYASKKKIGRPVGRGYQRGKRA
ncbi:MAG: alpha/beta hydrolase [Cytophagia bacterium]|nr:MAG: alpha/beta hydrolase [Cytophagales bacterium]TAG37554.1 MAG: alpha/beta hydrolase [Cytophagia bacterium]TAG74719.1 MAG: alpha/beta hydrolase [Runella slithyformis]TAG78671.1 MAG: alpha/beta hydrolase [Cytophagales bacterium]